MIGQIISHYEILAKLGAGGMGVLYKARDTRLGRLVALKFLPPSFQSDTDRKQRLIREAQAASSLDHTNICTIYEIDETADGQMFIAMAHYAGETLAEKIRRRRLSIQDSVEIATQIARGMSVAHERGIAIAT